MLFLDEIHRNSKYSCLAETIHPDSSSLIQKNWGLKCLSVCGYYWRWLKRICQTVCVCELLAVPPNNSFSSLNAGLFGSWVTQVLLWKLHPIAGLSSQSLYLSKIFQLIRGHATYKQDLELWTAWDAQSLIQTSKRDFWLEGKGKKGQPERDWEVIQVSIKIQGCWQITWDQMTFLGFLLYICLSKIILLSFILTTLLKHK